MLMSPHFHIDIRAGMAMIMFMLMLIILVKTLILKLLYATGPRASSFPSFN